MPYTQDTPQVITEIARADIGPDPAGDSRMTDPTPTFAEAADKVSALRAQRFADQTVKRWRRSHGSPRSLRCSSFYSIFSATLLRSAEDITGALDALYEGATAEADYLSNAQFDR